MKCGGVMLAAAAWHPGVDSLGLGPAFAAGAVPFLAGTVALGALAVVLAIEAAAAKAALAVRTALSVPPPT